MTDLDNMTTPSVRNPGVEVFGPANAWPSASTRVYVQINPIVGGVSQIGYDPATGRYWLRKLHYAGGGWSTWTEAGGGTTPSIPPVPIDAVRSGNLLAVLIEFDLSLDPGSIPAPTAFSVTHNTSRTVTAVTLVPPATVQCSVSQVMSGAGTTEVSYTAPGVMPLRSVDGVNVASFVNFPVQ